MTAFSSSRASTAAVRTERDSMDTISVPADRLWGAQTQRALGLFATSGDRQAPDRVGSVAPVNRTYVYADHLHGPLVPG